MTTNGSTQDRTKHDTKHDTKNDTKHDTKPGARQDDYDSPWKEAIEGMLPEFMKFYFPEAWRVIDWSQPHRFLDQELQKIVPGSDTGRRVVDKLVEVALTHLYTQRTRNDHSGRFDAKLRLIRLLYGQGWDKRRIIQLLRLIDWLLALPPELEQNLRDRVTTIEGEKHMQYVTSFERLAREEGMQEGMQQGLQQGIQEGMQQGQTELLIRQLTHRFGSLPDKARQRLEQASAEDIATWADRVLEVDSLDQVLGD